jgi:hypothetical protein
MKYPVFDAGCNANKPPVLPGMLPIYVGGSGAVDEARTRAHARKARDAHAFLCVDIKGLQTDLRGPTQHGETSDREVELSLRSLTQMVGWAREEAPNTRLGFYGIMPIRDWRTPLDHPMDSQQYQWWQAANDRLRWTRLDDGSAKPGLAMLVDAILSSLYTFSNNPFEWSIFAGATIREARRYGRCVYAFLHPSYCGDNATITGKRMPVVDWIQQLDMCRNLTDGIVIWDDTRPYDAGEPWRVATDKWLAKL